jgi:hypothetical protein
LTPVEEEEGDNEVKSVICLSNEWTQRVQQPLYFDHGC